MESLFRVAYGPSPPPVEKKRPSRGRSAGRRQPAAHLPLARSIVLKKGVPHRSKEARRLVEEYWQSVWHSHHEPPLYHTFSHRYGGAKGIPYATRKATQIGSAAGPGVQSFLENVPDCVAASDSAFNEGNLSVAQTHLQHALTVLQNGAEPLGLLTVEALTRHHSSSAEDEERSFWVSEVLRRMGILKLIHGDYADARELFNRSITARPLHLDGYILRASCCEALRCFAEAHEDYSKYMKMVEPSMEVLAHSSKCAAEAGLSEIARDQLGRLLQLSEEVLASTAAALNQEVDQPIAANHCQMSSSLPPISSAAWAVSSFVPTTDGDASSSLEQLRSACAFYVTHAYFYLGYVAEAEATSKESLTPAEVDALHLQALSYYRVAVSNTDYVQSYEDSVQRSMNVGNYALARHLLLYLQKMNPDCAGYLLDTARACRAEGDIQGELRALSAALDRQQTLTERRSTLFARGTVYADKLSDWSRAIRDFTMLLVIPTVQQPAAEADGGVAVVDWCTPLALVRRAAAYRHRQAQGNRTSLLQREDDEAALADYAAFLDSLAEIETSGCEAVDVPELCQPHNVIAALLFLANGAYYRHQYSNAVRYFCRAIALGWQPESSTPPPLPKTERLADQLFTSMAHHVMTVYPVGDDMFRVPYEPREATTLPTSTSATTSTETRRAPKVSERSTAGGFRTTAAEGERSGFACPPLMYMVVDQRYQQLRALEPTFFAAIEGEFLDAWEPYRAEVERLKDEALSSRVGRRSKR